MKKLCIILLGLTLSLSFNNAISQVKNSKSITVAINGNCGMCKKTIDKSGTEGKISMVNWDIDSKQAEITFDTTKTSKEAILKKIAQAGYDNQEFRAPDDVYENLHECCKYDRDHRISGDAKSTHVDHEKMDHSRTQDKQHINKEAKDFDPVFNAYIDLKDALVQSNAKKAGASASQLSTTIQKVDMNSLEEAEHTTWMKVKGSLDKIANQIVQEDQLENQRAHFMNLSNQMYDLGKVANTEIELYWVFCPMANDNQGAYWLSRENAVKNPYYGNKMMSCGEVKEKI